MLNGIGPRRYTAPTVAGRERRCQALASSAVVEQFRGTAAAPGCVGDGRRGGREEQRPQADGGGAARRGHDDARQRAPRSSTSRSWPSVLRSLGCAVDRRRTTTVADRRAGRARPRRPTTTGVEAARVDLRARPAGGPVPASRRRRCPAATRSAPGRWTCTQAGLRRAGRDRPRSSTAAWSRRRRDLHGAQIWLDFPSVGATENILMAAVLADGHDGDRQRGARARDRRPVHDAAADGRQDRRRGQLDADRARRRPACSPPSTGSSATGSWAPPGPSPPR